MDWECAYIFVQSVTLHSLVGGNIYVKRVQLMLVCMMNCGWKHKSGLMENAFSVTEYKICSVILDVEIDGEFPHPPTSN